MVLTPAELVSVTTMERLRRLFSACLNVAGQPADSPRLDLSRLSEQVQLEFRELFRCEVNGPTWNTLSFQDFERGILNMGVAYMGRCKKINELRNCYFRYELVKRNNSADWQKNDVLWARVNLDTKLINCSQLLGCDPNDCEVSSPRDTTQLIRSLTTGPVQTRGEASDLLEMVRHLDDDSRDFLRHLNIDPTRAAGFLFDGQELINKRLRENSTVRDLTNMYLQTKLKRALVALTAFTDGATGSSRTSFREGQRVVFLDFYGDENTATIQRVRPGFFFDIVLNSGATIKHVTACDLRPDTESRLGPSPVFPGGLRCGCGRPDCAISALLEIPSLFTFDPDPVSWSTRQEEAEGVLLPSLFCFVDGRVTLPPAKVEEFLMTLGTEKLTLERRDIGASFSQKLWDRCGIADDVLRAHRRVVQEPNRCFFNHMGLALGINPFLMQACFRREAKRQLDLNREALTVQHEARRRETQEELDRMTPMREDADDETRARYNMLADILSTIETHDPKDIYTSCLQEGVFVDYSILLRIWPRELADTRVCVIPFTATGQRNGRYEIYSPQYALVYTPANSLCVAPDGSWTGRDVIIHFNHHHFSLLAPRDNEPAAAATRECEKTIDKVKRFFKVSKLPVHDSATQIDFDLSIAALGSGSVAGAGAGGSPIREPVGGESQVLPSPPMPLRSIEGAVDAAIRGIQSHPNAAERLEAIKKAKLIVKNLAANRSNLDKYGKLRMSTDVMTKCIMPVPAALSLLLAAGFVQVSEGSENFLVHRMDATGEGRLKAAFDRLGLISQ